MAKRLFDLVVAGGGIVVALPLIAAIAIAVKMTSSGPVFYRGIRAGLGGEPFRILKFRTMVTNAELIGGPSTAFNDHRLTRIGASLRKYKLDELPNLFLVVTGKMSLVGPRPQVLEYTNLYTDEERLMLSVLPGITDYASIELIDLDARLGIENVDERYRNEIEPRKNVLRLRYVRERSLWIDAKILFHTAKRLTTIRKLWITRR